MKLAVIFNQDRIFGKLTKIFTGCYAYHVGWVDEERGLFYDMNFINRRRPWPRYRGSNVMLFDVPEVTREYLEHQLTHEESIYGFLEYSLFLVRPIYHLFGKSTRNAGGLICSEKCNNDMRNCGVWTPWEKSDAPPSPCDLYRFMMGRV